MANDIGRKRKAQTGRNVCVNFPDPDVHTKLQTLAWELKTSVSAIVFELVKRSLPAIVSRKESRRISLDGVTIEV